MKFEIKTMDGKTYIIDNFYGDEQMAREYMEGFGYKVKEVKCLTCLGNEKGNYTIYTNEHRESMNWRDYWGIR